MSKPMIKMLTVVSIFFLLIFGWYGIRQAIFYWYVKHYSPPLATVSSAKVSATNWQPLIHAIGSLSAVNGIDMTTEVPGIIDNIHFNSGDVVKAGAPIITLRANIEKAALESAEAKLKLAELNNDREQKLFARKVSSQALLDLKSSELRQAKANVQSLKAQINQKIVTAPFAGKLGIRLINLGQYIAPGVPIVTLQSLNPLYVLFSLTEQHADQINLGQTVQVQFSNNKKIMGKVTAINAKVEVNSRTLLIQATIPNDDLVLYPGMYANVKVLLASQGETLTVPQTAISYSLSGDYVFKLKSVNDKHQVLRQYVKVGERRGERVAILQGLKAGDEVVVSGQLKLQDGMSVIIDNRVT